MQHEAGPAANPLPPVAGEGRVRVDTERLVFFPRPAGPIASTRRRLRPTLTPTLSLLAEGEGAEEH